MTRWRKALRPRGATRATCTHRCGSSSPAALISGCPGEKIHKVSIAYYDGEHGRFDLENREANQNGSLLEAVTKDQAQYRASTADPLTGLSEANLYAFIFGIKKPFVHVPWPTLRLGYCASRIASFEAEAEPLAIEVTSASGASPTAVLCRAVNDGHFRSTTLRKNLRDPERVYGQRMPVRPRALRGDSGRVADHRHRSARGGGICPGRHQIPHTIRSRGDSQPWRRRGRPSAWCNRAAPVDIETLRAQAEVEPVKSPGGRTCRTATAQAPISWALTCANVRLALLRQSTADLSGGRQVKRPTDRFRF